MKAGVPGLASHSQALLKSEALDIEETVPVGKEGQMGPKDLVVPPAAAELLFPQPGSWRSRHEVQLAALGGGVGQGCSSTWWGRDVLLRSDTGRPKANPLQLSMMLLAAPGYRWLGGHH